MKNLIKTIITSFALMLVTTLASAQDPIKISPNMHKLLLENEHVRVFEFNAKPGEKLAMHSHPNHVMYSLTGGKLKFTMPDGKTNEVEITPGTAKWVDATTHAVENIGKTEVKVVAIELQNKKETESTKKK